MFKDRKAVASGHFQVRDDEGGKGELRAVRILSFTHQVADGFVTAANKMNGGGYPVGTKRLFDKQLVGFLIFNHQDGFVVDAHTRH